MLRSRPRSGPYYFPCYLSIKMTIKKINKPRLSQRFEWKMVKRHVAGKKLLGLQHCRETSINSSLPVRPGGINPDHPSVTGQILPSWDNAPTRLPLPYRLSIQMWSTHSLRSGQDPSLQRKYTPHPRPGNSPSVVQKDFVLIKRHRRPSAHPVVQCYHPDCLCLIA